MELTTVLEKTLIEKAFRYQNEEVYCHPLFTSLYKGKHCGAYSTGGSDGPGAYIPLNKLPSHIKRHFDDAVQKSIIDRIKVTVFSKMIFAPPSFEPYFVQRIREIFHYHEYRDFKKLYATYDCYTSDEITDRAILHAVMALMLPFYRNKTKLRFMFRFLEQAHLGIDLPLSTVEALRKLLSRKEKAGFPQALIHRGIGQPSNNMELTPLMKNVIVVLALEITTSKSARLIKEDIDIILNNLPNAKEAGIYSVSDKKINDYINSPEADVAIRYAKDEPIEFRRNVTGIIRFSRPSAPLVRVCVDGYSFQVKYLNLDLDEADYPVGIFFYDDRSDYVIAMEIGVSENYEMLMKAFELYFKKSGNACPRELVMDKFTYKLLKKNKRLVKFLEDNGTEIIKSSNPNRKSRLERFFETFQQLMLSGGLISYLGPGIRSRLRNSHPHKAFKMLLAKNLPTKFALFPMLRRLVNSNYNAGYHTAQFDGDPKTRFETEKENPAATFDDEVIPFLLHELHEVTFWGTSLVIRRGDNFHFYYKREFEFLLKYNGVKVDAYIEGNDPSKLKVYERGSKKQICIIPEYMLVPSARFDRSEAQKEFVRQFCKETQKLIDLHLHYLNSKFESVSKALGRDIYKYTKMALNKKAESTEQEETRVLDHDDDNPALKAAHSNTPRRKGGGREAHLKKFNVELVSTF